MSIWNLIIPRKARRRFGSYGCLDETELAAFVDKSLDRRAADRAIRHLGACVECRSQVVFLVRMQRPANNIEPPPAWLARVEDITNGPAKARFQWQLATAGFGVAVAILILVMLLRPTDHLPVPPQASSSAISPVVSASTALPSRPSVTPGATNRDVVRRTAIGATVEIITPLEGSHISSNSKIRWKPIDGSVYYEIELLSKDGDLIFQSKEKEAAAAIPDALPITEKQEVFVMVHAHLTDGKTVASQAVRLVLIPGS